MQEVDSIVGEKGEIVERFREEVTREDDDSWLIVETNFSLNWELKLLYNKIVLIRIGHIS